MHVPCPVPLDQPWSPMGYQVVQVSEEQKLPLAGGPPKVKGSPARSPLGYRVNVVAEEDIPLPPKPKLQWSLRREPPRTKPALIWAPIAAGSFFFLLPVIAIAFAIGSQQAPEPPPHFVQGQQFQPEPMAPPEVIIPDALFKNAAAKPPADEPAEIPQPAPKNQAAGLAKDDGACENFGTQMEFVRNPQVAAKLAQEQGKLTFLLHVSGNFEDSRFT